MIRLGHFVVRRSAGARRRIQLRSSAVAPQSALSAKTDDVSIRWKASSAAQKEVPDSQSVSSKHLHLVTCAIERMLDEKAANSGSVSADNPSAVDEKSELVEKAWRAFEVREKVKVTDCSVLKQGENSQPLYLIINE